MITPEARAVLAEMATDLEEMPLPLTFAGELTAFLKITAAGQILRQLNSSDLADPVIDRLLVAIQLIGAISGGEA